jgi:hypothetical protein
MPNVFKLGPVSTTDQDLQPSAQLQAHVAALAREVARTGALPGTGVNQEATLLQEKEDVLAGDPRKIARAEKLLQYLAGKLDDAAPAFCHFDYSAAEEAYGFWPELDSLAEAVREGEVLGVDDLAEVPDDYLGLARLVNDHGNVTLYEYALAPQEAAKDVLRVASLGEVPAGYAGLVLVTPQPDSARVFRLAPAGRELWSVV